MVSAPGVLVCKLLNTSFTLSAACYQLLKVLQHFFWYPSKTHHSCPLLFILYTSNIVDIASKHGIFIHLYDDDIQLHIKADDIQLLIKLSAKTLSMLSLAWLVVTLLYCNSNNSFIITVH